MNKDSSVHLIYHDPSDLGSLILIRIIPKERTLSACSTKSFRLSTENDGIFWLKQAYNFLNQLPIVAY